MKVIDMHCDTMKAILDNRDIGKNINLKNFILLLYGIALTIYLRIKIMSKSEISRVNSLIYDLFCCSECLL